MRCLGIIAIVLSVGCFEPAKVVVGVEDGALTEEQLQALEDDCENGNEEACEELDAIEESNNSDPPEPEEEDPASDPGEWESWEDVDTSDPEEIIEWFEETVQDCEDGNWESCEELEVIEEIFEELLDECFDERNAEACETLEDLEELFEDLEDDFESEGPGGGGPGESPEEILEFAEQLDEECENGNQRACNALDEILDNIYENCENNSGCEY